MRLLSAPIHFFKGKTLYESLIYMTSCSWILMPCPTKNDKIILVRYIIYSKRTSIALLQHYSVFASSPWPVHLNLHVVRLIKIFYVDQQLCLLIGVFFTSVYIECTVMILSFRTDIPGQTVQTQIRLLLEEQSDHGLHCLPFRLHRLDSLHYSRAT